MKWVDRVNNDLPKNAEDMSRLFEEAGFQIGPISIDFGSGEWVWTPEDEQLALSISFEIRKAIGEEIKKATNNG
jgi:hypothetical protein